MIIIIIVVVFFFQRRKWLEILRYHFWRVFFFALLLSRLPLRCTDRLANYFPASSSTPRDHLTRLDDLAAKSPPTDDDATGEFMQIRRALITILPQDYARTTTLRPRSRCKQYYVPETFAVCFATRTPWRTSHQPRPIGNQPEEVRKYLVCGNWYVFVWHSCEKLVWPGFAKYFNVYAGGVSFQPHSQEIWYNLHIQLRQCLAHSISMGLYDHPWNLISNSFCVISIFANTASTPPPPNTSFLSFCKSFYANI